MSSLITVSRGYLDYHATTMACPSSRSQVSLKMLTNILGDVVSFQSATITRTAGVCTPGPHALDLRHPDVQQLLHNIALSDAAVTYLAGVCQHLHAQHAARQASTGITSRAAAAAGGIGTSGGGAAGGGVALSSFAELVVPADHKLLRLPGGQAAIEKHADQVKQQIGIAVRTRPAIAIKLLRCATELLRVAHNVRVQAASEAEADAAAALESGVPTSAPTPTPALAAGSSSKGANSSSGGSSGSGKNSASSSRGTSSSGGSAASSSSSSGGGGVSLPFSSAVNLQLLLESIPLAAAEGERAGGCIQALVSSLSLLSLATGAISIEERRAFLAARGDFLLQVLLLVLKAVDGAGQQQEAPSPSQVDLCRRSVLELLHYFVFGGGGVAASGAGE